MGMPGQGVTLLIAATKEAITQIGRNAWEFSSQSAPEGLLARCPDKDKLAPIALAIIPPTVALVCGHQVVACLWVCGRIARISFPVFS